MFCKFPPPTMNKIPQNMAELSNSLLIYSLLGATIGNQGTPIMNLQCFSLPTMSRTPQNMSKNQISYFGWQPFLAIQDGCHIEDLIWLSMLPATFIAIWRFPNFLSFPMSRLVPPLPCMLPCRLITVYGSCTWLTCMRTVPSTFQKKWPKNRPSTT